MLYAVKKANESNERLISRFKKLVQRSRIINDVKKGRYFVTKPTKKYIRNAAIIKAGHRARKAKEQFRAS